MLKYLMLIPTLLFLVTYTTINIRINNQVKMILNDFDSANECNYISTRKFADGELTDTEYLSYRCRLKPNIKTLYFYVNKNTNEVVSSSLFPTSYESIEGSAPLLCTTGVSKTDQKNIYDVCSIFIVYEKILTGRHELFFSTPLTINNNKALRVKIMQQEYTQNVDNFL